MATYLVARGWQHYVKLSISQWSIPFLNINLPTKNCNIELLTQKDLIVISATSYLVFNRSYFFC